MTRNSIKEYAEAIKGRYRKVTKSEKSKILDEFTKATGLNRKAAIRLLNRRSLASKKKLGLIIGGLITFFVSLKRD